MFRFVNKIFRCETQKNIPYSENLKKILKFYDTRK